jgi:hypothetical protein
MRSADSVESKCNCPAVMDKKPWSRAVGLARFCATKAAAAIGGITFD